jgi:HlyD family secretion protein
MMRTLLRIALIFGVIAGAGAILYRPAMNYWKEQSRPKFKSEKVERGEIVFVRNSTGTIKPVLSVHVGAVVSGPILALYVEFNEEVKKDQLLATIDPRIYEAGVARDKAALATRVAEVLRTKARLQQAKNDEGRALDLRADNKDYISDSEMDQYKFNRIALESELELMNAAVDQAEANLLNSEANLSYTKITSPVDGIVIDRKIDPGQSLAAQFQTPELFVVAPDMRNEMHVFASVDETDIGLIRSAQEAGQPVHFTVEAYQGELFEGKVSQIRLSSTTTQNVVTYPVVISAPNPDLKLLPGMTAHISFQIDRKDNTLKIPNAALRYFPKREHVREQDRELLDGVQTEDRRDDSAAAPPATEKVNAQRNRNKRHVWVKDGDLLRAVEIVCGISDYKHTELVSGDIEENAELVVGLETN